MIENRSNYINLSTPQRQSYAAIFIIIYRLSKSMTWNIIPAILISFVGGTEAKLGRLLFVLLWVAVVLSIFGIVSFYKYYFYIKDNKLIVHKGVFKKITLEIPFERIQSINNEQNLIHRLFSVVKLNVDTAGSARDEVQLSALKTEIANELRQNLLDYKSKTKSISETVEQSGFVEDITTNKKIIFRLDFLQLMRVGITANHLSSFGLIVFFFFSIFDKIREVGLDIQSKLEEYIPLAEAIMNSVFMVFFLAVLFFIVSFILSLVLTVLRFFGLKMYRIGDGFIIESGLFNRKQYAAKDNKIQILSWSQNLLERLSKIYTIVIQQAASVQTPASKIAIAKGLSYENIDAVGQYIYKDNYVDLERMKWYAVDNYYLYRMMARFTMLFAIPIIILLTIGMYEVLLPVGSIYVILIFSCVLRYRKKKYGISDNIVAVRGGAFGHQLSLMELHKVQNIKLSQTPFQRSRQLSSLNIFTASTTIRIPEISTKLAWEMNDYLVYKVESSNKPWM